MAILRAKAVLKLTGLSKSHLYTMIKDGAFPPPVKLSVRAVGWHEETIDNWMKSRPSARC